MARAAVFAGLLASVGAIVGSFALMRSTDRAAWIEAVHWTAYLSMGLLSLLLVGLVTVDAVRIVGWAVAAAAELIGVHSPSAPDEERVRFVSGAANLVVVGVSGVVLALGYREARRVARVVEVRIPIDGLPPALDGLRIVQLSDVHVGPTIRRSYLQGIVDRVNELDADIIAITGDLVDGSVEGLRDDIAPLADLRSRMGAFFCTGNHEYYSGVDAWLAEVLRLGIRPLVNEHVVLERGGARVLVAGVTDQSAGRMKVSHACDPAGACEGAPPCHARVLLAHQPVTAYAAAETKGYDLQLSGHVHGGQYVPWAWLITAVQPFAAGLHRHLGMWIYTSRGTGYWGPPVRLGAPSEITLLKLVTA
jgi:predicted MPP superfamily phosphohydrolase